MPQTLAEMIQQALHGAPSPERPQEEPSTPAFNPEAARSAISELRKHASYLRKLASGEPGNLGTDMNAPRHTGTPDVVRAGMLPAGPASGALPTDAKRNTGGAGGHASPRAKATTHHPKLNTNEGPAAMRHSDHSANESSALNEILTATPYSDPVPSRLLTHAAEGGDPNIHKKASASQPSADAIRAEIARRIQQRSTS